MDNLGHAPNAHVKEFHAVSPGAYLPQILISVRARAMSNMASTREGRSPGLCSSHTCQKRTSWGAWHGILTGVRSCNSRASQYAQNEVHGLALLDTAYALPLQTWQERSGENTLSTVHCFCLGSCTSFRYFRLVQAEAADMLKRNAKKECLYRSAPCFQQLDSICRTDTCNAGQNSNNWASTLNQVRFLQLRCTSSAASLAAPISFKILDKVYMFSTCEGCLSLETIACV